MNGYRGKLLIVDLTSGEIRDEPLNAEYTQKFIGGSGLACRYLYDLIDADTDPLGPENPLVFMTGPLVGTRAPSCGRYVICARSPQTRIWGESNIGGFLGPELRFAGYDGIMIRGQAPGPTYLFIKDGQAELRSASHLWRQDSYKTQEVIKRELKDRRVRVACIGEAGENLVNYAAVMADAGRAAGRTGMGAVMGAKRLKAVACRGRGRIPLADEARFNALAQESLSEVEEDITTQILLQTGTAGSADYFSLLGNMPNRYFAQGSFPGVEEISGGAMAETILKSTSGCFGCPAQCGRQVEVKRYGLAETDGPEYETVASLGSLLLIDDLEAISYLDHLCDTYGLDTISTGVTVALVHKLYEEGVIGPQEAEGLELRWGDPEPVIRLVEMIAKREGLGDLLAEGVLAVAKEFGVEGWAAQVQGLEVPMHDPRASAGVALSYVTSPRGACHNKSDMYWVDVGRIIEEIGVVATDRFREEGKAEVVARHQNWRGVCDALITCILMNVPVQGVVEMLNTATGWDMDLEEMMTIGERIFNLKRALNIKLGWDREGERLPSFLLQPLEEGGTGGYVPDVERLLLDYYRVRGWERETGKPTAEHLRRVGLEDIARDLWEGV
ncbi:MAG: aldehyde ferredoxin oxidoreductase family protein [Anaerolineae bacterium]